MVIGDRDDFMLSPFDSQVPPPATATIQTDRGEIEEFQNFILTGVEKGTGEIKSCISLCCDELKLRDIISSNQKAILMLLSRIDKCTNNPLN